MCVPIWPCVLQHCYSVITSIGINRLPLVSTGMSEDLLLFLAIFFLSSCAAAYPTHRFEPSMFVSQRALTTAGSCIFICPG